MQQRLRLTRLAVWGARVGPCGAKRVPGSQRFRLRGRIFLVTNRLPLTAVACCERVRSSKPGNCASGLRASASQVPAERCTVERGCSRGGRQWIRGFGGRLSLRRPVIVRTGRMPKMPSRSAEQRLGALAKANEVRRERARLKRELATGRVEFERVISDPPACAQTAILRDLLLAVPRVGPARADRALARCQISPNKTVAGLSDRQRAALIQLLPL